MQDTISITDGNDLLIISYQDLVRYHGRDGVALAYKLLELAFRELVPGQVPAREQITILSGVYGPGIIDGIEMITRAQRRGALVIKPLLAADKLAPDAADGQGGKYYFEIAYADQRLVITLKHGLLPAEFITLAYKTHDSTITADEKIRLRYLKEEIAEFLLAQQAEDLFDYYRAGLPVNTD